MTQEKFISKVKAIYGDRYDLSKVVYKGWDNEVIVTDSRTKEEILVKPKYFLYKRNRITKLERTNNFIKKSKEKFGDKFDYSKTKYVNSQTPVTLICKEHGEFNVNMYAHLNSKDGLCPLCGNAVEKKYGRGGKRRLSTSYIVNKCKKFYGEKYDYSKIEYKGGNAKKEVVEIVCPTHGSFFKCVDNINKRDCGCPRCAKEKKRSNDIISIANKFIERSKNKFGDRFDYSEVKYIDSQTPVTLMCKKHGIKFSTTPSNHFITRFGGCKECYKEYIESTKSKKIRIKLTEEERKERRRECEEKHFIEKGIIKFGDRFDYSEVKYIDCETPVNIIDKESNNEMFSIKPSSFLQSVHGRPDKIGMTTEEFIERARKLHGDKYDYSKVNYKATHERVCIICPIHGEFLQMAHDHLKASRGGCGCPKCANMVSKLEENVIDRLTKENIKFKKEYTNEKIFGKMRGDFFIKSYNVMIECQGRQHFEESNTLHHSYGGSLSGQIERDYNFNKCCKDANIKLLYYFDEDNAKGADYLNDEKFNGIYTEKNTFTNIDSLISCIKNA